MVNNGLCVDIGYTFFKVDGSALFQSARIDGTDFLNFDTRKGRDIHPRYFCGPRHLCQKMFQGCAIYARILKSKVSKQMERFGNL